MMIVSITLMLSVALPSATPGRTVIAGRNLPAHQKTSPPELEEAASLSAEVVRLIDERKYDKALQLAKRALAIRERALGPDHELVASALNALASIHLGKHQAPAAELLYRRSLGILEKKFGGHSQELTATLESLGLVRFLSDDYVGSAEYYKRSLAIKEKALGPDHPDLLVLLYDCACTLTLSKRLSEALLYEDRAEKIRGAPPSSTVSQNLLQRAAIVRFEPEYPADAKESRIFGTVVVEVIVNECGAVISTRVKSGPGKLRRAAEAAARSWRFTPTKLDGVLVKVIGTITFNFLL